MAELDDKALWQLIATLTLEEKAALCSGASGWDTKAIPAKGIPALRMSDGPHGLRYVNPPAVEKETGAHTKPATCFPPAVALACSFSPQLARRVGEAAAEECLASGVGLLLGPGVNIKRSPLGGRNFEYYSEDPLLAGEMAAGFIGGLQGKGVGASLKHYAVNSQEGFRMSINAAVDERALFDLYLKPFEIAVKKAQPATVMCSYNKVNGTYASENRRLLTEILRLRFGFQGAVVSDWGAVNDRAEGLRAGLDLEMPASGDANDRLIVAAVREGRLTEDALDAACWNILRLVFRFAQQPPYPACDFTAHHALAVEALEKRAVLQKNDSLLPLAPTERVAVIGEMASAPRFQGGGSSIVNPMQLTSPLAALAAAGLPHAYAPGHAGLQISEALLAEAEKTAAGAEKVLLFLGLPDSFECEGADRTHLRLPDCQLQLLERVAAVNPNLCVVLCCGSPVEAPWLGKAKALLCLYLGGEGVGEAAVNLLYGRANPSGKLAESWPLSLADTPCATHYPAGPIEVSYNESIFVGYRYYQSAEKPMLFPFGHGLSYTAFEYSNLRLSQAALAEGQSLTAAFTLKNTGVVAGEEVVQLYLARKSSASFQPARELAAFARVALAPGEEHEVELQLPWAALVYYEPGAKASIVEAGEYEVRVGPSCAVLPLHAAFTAEGVKASPAAPFAATGSYGTITGNTFPKEAFATLYGVPLSDNRLPQKGQYAFDTPLGLMGGSLAARCLLWVAKRISRSTLHFIAGDEAANRAIADRMAVEMPFKNIPLNTSGRVSWRAAAHLLDFCNGKGGFFRFLGALGKRR